jgi:hypothetical protein
MRFNRLRRWAALALAGLLLAVLARPGQAQPPAFTPPNLVQGQSYSIRAGDATAINGLHPADILGAGPIVLIACADLGLVCYDAGGGVDDLNALSYGADFTDPDLPPVQFSVSPGATGRANTAVAAEAGCSPAQPQADVFESAYDGDNNQDLDGDGTACGGNAGYGLGLVEAAQGDSVDALATDPCETVDLDCDGVPDRPVYFSLTPNSPSLTLLGASASTILVAGGGPFAELWATGSTLGLALGDVIDALCLSEDGDGVYSANDVVVVSLAPGSPTLATLGASSGDLIGTAPLRVMARASELGLASGDNLSAAQCQQFAPGDVFLFMPRLSR